MGFKEMQKKYPCIGDVRGTGAMMGIEFIKDEKKTPDAEIVGKIVQNAMNKGLMLEAAGTFNNVIRILCPLVATDEQLEAGLKIFEEALAEDIDSQEVQTSEPVEETTKKDSYIR